LHRETEPVVIAALLCDSSMVGIVQMKVAGEVLRGRHSGITTVVLALFG
jgi:hypothetical protein